MHLVKDSVLLELLNDSNNNNEIDPILYLTFVFNNIRSSIDLSIEKRLLNIEPMTNDENVIKYKYKLETHREKVIQFLTEIEQDLIGKIRLNNLYYQNKLKHFTNQLNVLRKGSIEQNYISIKNDLIGQDMFYINEIPTLHSSEFIGSLVIVRPSCLDDVQIEAIE